MTGQGTIVIGERFAVDGTAIEVLRRTPEGDWTARGDDGRHYLVSVWPFGDPEIVTATPAVEDKPDLSLTAVGPSSASDALNAIVTDGGIDGDSPTAETASVLAEPQQVSSIEAQVPSVLPAERSAQPGGIASDATAAAGTSAPIHHEAQIQLGDDAANRNRNLQTSLICLPR